MRFPEKWDGCFSGWVGVPRQHLGRECPGPGTGRWVSSGGLGLCLGSPVLVVPIGLVHAKQVLLQRYVPQYVFAQGMPGGSSTLLRTEVSCRIFPCNSPCRHIRSDLETKIHAF